jgi:hypothetical protein
VFDHNLLIAQHLPMCMANPACASNTTTGNVRLVRASTLAGDDCKSAIARKREYLTTRFKT